MDQYIAERKLLYGLRGENLKKEFSVRIYPPHHVEEGMVNFLVGQNGCSGCHIEIDGLDQKFSEEFYGADSIQALQLASQGVDFLLKRLQKKYDFFYLNGEPYFDE